MDDSLRTRGPGDRRELNVDQSGRIDALLASAYPDLSRARLQRLIEAGDVLLNGETVRKSARASAGDTLALVLEPVDHEVAPTGLTFEVLFEDASVLAINKPPGVAVHGGPGDGAPTVAAWFVEHYPEESSAFDSERPGIVHRLDKGTSGVLLLARTPQASAALSAAFEARETTKTYIALCDGVPDRPRAMIDAPIARHQGDRTRMTIADHGRESQTEYERLGDLRGVSLLEARPVTGRTHQIRVHLAAINAPVRADRVYGKRGDGRHFLHAWRMEIPHPDGGRLQVTAPLAPDMAEEVRTVGLEEVALPYCEPIPSSVLQEPS